MTALLPSAPPEFYNFISDDFDKWAEEPDKLALYWVSEKRDRERKITFAEMRDSSKRLAGALQNLSGVKLACRDPLSGLCSTVASTLLPR